MTEPGAVTEFRTMLLACASVSGAGITSGRILYPAAIATADDTTTPTTKPYAVLGEERHTRTPFAGPGVTGLPSGTMIAVFHFDSDTGTVEDFARNVCSELQTQMTGLPIRSATAELASEPAAGAVAADNTTTTALEITATVTVEWGLTG